jgi:VanZ family protein
LRAALSWLPVVAYMGLIWFLSSRTLDVHLDTVPFRDKGVHFLEFGVLAFLMTHAVRATWPQARRGALAAFWLTASFGLSDELHQGFVPGRSPDVLDLGADAVGALAAILLYALVRALWQRRAQARAVIEAPGERSSEESR